MKTLIVLAILALTGCAAVQESPDLEFDWTERPDFLKLRNDFGWSDDWSARCQLGRPAGEMASAMNSESWEEAAKIGLKWVKRCPIDIRGHYYTAISLSELGRDVEAENHIAWMEGLMDSIVESGDGNSCETAYVVISISEEYDALMLFGLERKSQALVSGPMMCDLITAVEEDGEEVSIYFNPAAHFARLAKILK